LAVKKLSLSKTLNEETTLSQLAQKLAGDRREFFGLLVERKG
jgi:hypothetical protein